MSIAKLLVSLCKQKGLTKQALADALGLHITQDKRYEAGTSQPSLEALKKLAQTFRVTTDSLIFEPKEQRIVKQLLEGMIIKYEAERWSSKAR